MTSRELVFYIRAENQASGVLRKVASDIRAVRASNQTITVQKKYADQTEKALNSNNRALKAASQGLSINTKSLAVRKADVDAQLKQLRTYRQFNSIQQQIRTNATQITKAETAAAEARSKVSGISKYASGYQQLAIQADVAAEHVATLRRQEELLGSSLDEVRLKAQSEALALDEATAANKVQRIQAIASAFKDAGRMAQIVGVVGVAALGALAIKAANFQTQTSLAATQARKPDAPVGSVAGIQAKLSTVVLKQMKQFPAASKDMADSLYEIFSGTNVQSIPKAANMLKVFNQMAVAGGTDLKTMTDAGISLYNNFPHEFSTMTDAANHFFAAVRYARTTPAQFANSLSNVLPVAKAVGRNFTDVADAMALVTRQSGGRVTSRDSTGLARLLEMLSRKDVIDGLKTYGINAKEANGQLKPLRVLMNDIYNTFVKTGKLKPGPDTLNFFKMISAAGSGGKGTAGTIQGRRVFDYLITNMKDYNQISQKINKDTDEFFKSYGAQSQTASVRFNVALNNLRAFGIEIGAAAIPALLMFFKPLYQIVQWFDKLSNSTKSFIARAAVLASVGAIIGGTLMRLTVVASAMAKAVSLLVGGKGLARLAEEEGAVRIRTAALLGVFGLIMILWIKYPGVINGIVNALGGLKTVLIAIVGVLAALKLEAFITGLTAAGTAAAGAAGEVGILRAALLGLGGPEVLGAIALVVAALATIKGIHKLIDLTTGGDDFKKVATTIGGRGLDLNKKTGKYRLEPFDPGNGPLIPAQDLNDFQARAYLSQIKAAAAKSNAAARASGKAIFDGSSPFQNLIGAAPKLKVIPKVIPGPTRAGAVLAQTAAQETAKYMAQLKAVGELEKQYTATPNYDTYVAYTKGLNALNAKFSSDMYKGYTSDYLSKVTSANKKAVKDATSTAKKATAVLQQTWTQAASTLQSNFSQMSQMNSSAFGTIFQGPFSQSPRQQNENAYGHKVTGKDVLKDIKSQVAQFKTWRSLLNKLAKDGAPFALLQQIEQAGPASLPQLKALLTLNKANLHSYFKTFSRGQSLIDIATKDDLTKTLAHYRTFGQNVALAIIQGLRDERTPSLNYFEGLIKEMFPTLAAKAKHPKAKTSGGLKPTVGTTVPKTHPAKAPPKGHTSTRTTQLAGGDVYHTYNVTVQGDPADVKKTMKQVVFTQRNRGR